MPEANLILRGLEEMFPENLFISRLLHCIEEYPDAYWGDALSRGQIRSKMWILHELSRLEMTNLGRVMVCGGWYGILSRMILDSDFLHAHHVLSLDKNDDCKDIAAALNREYFEEDMFIAFSLDMLRFTDYEYRDTIFNTSCEHLTRRDFESWWSKIPSGKLTILQSNDFSSCLEHRNCVTDVEQFIEQAPMQEIHFQGSIPTQKYTRFMLIGVK